MSCKNWTWVASSSKTELGGVEILPKLQADITEFEVVKFVGYDTHTENKLWHGHSRGNFMDQTTITTFLQCDFPINIAQFGHNDKLLYSEINWICFKLITLAQIKELMNEKAAKKALVPVYKNWNTTWKWSHKSVTDKSATLLIQSVKFGGFMYSCVKCANLWFRFQKTYYVHKSWYFSLLR